MTRPSNTTAHMTETTLTSTNSVGNLRWIMMEGAVRVVAIYVARRGDTWRSIADRLTEHSVDRLADLNDISTPVLMGQIVALAEMPSTTVYGLITRRWNGPERQGEEST